MKALCPALFIAAPSSGQGKTTVTAAMARYFRRQGLKVRVFKTGPDYLDPQILAQASGAPVEQLDLWMAGADWCRHRLFLAAREADLILIEGAMGLFDGEPSSADLAALFGVPVALLMDVKGMAQTAAAIALGLAAYRDDVEICGLLANHCASARHEELIRSALAERMPLLGCLKRDPEVSLPQRHLGLVQASEQSEELEALLEKGADWLQQCGAVELPAAVEFADAPVAAVSDGALDGVRIAVARDEAFSFIYQANLDLLQAMGARLSFFSPLHDRELPVADALWLPGGYPELHAAGLAANQVMLEQLRNFHKAGRPVLAECGGMLYCLESLTDLEMQTHTMAGILPGAGAMRGKRGCQGLQTACLPEGEIRAHAHHRSRADIPLQPAGYGRRQRHAANGESIFRHGRLTATYLHLFFPSAPDVVAALFRPAPAHP